MATVRMEHDCREAHANDLEPYLDEFYGLRCVSGRIVASIETTSTEHPWFASTTITLAADAAKEE